MEDTANNHPATLNLANNSNNHVHTSSSRPGNPSQNEEESSSKTTEGAIQVSTSTGSHDSHDDDDDAPHCPICFQHEQLAVAPCQHIICIPCAERILLSGGNGSGAGQSPTREIGEFVSPDYPAGREQGIDELKIPAWNACPMCRKSLFLWDLRRHVHNVSADTTVHNEKEHKSEDSRRSPITTLSGDYVYSREAPDFTKIPFLRSSVWIESAQGAPQGRVGYGSFHFPPHAHDNEDDDDNADKEEYLASTKAFYNLDKVSHKRLLLQDCLYHDESRVLSARLVDEDEMAVDESLYRLILAFSADGSFVRTGAMVVEQPPLAPSRHMALFPFDGFWDFEGEQITVVGHKCIVNGQPILLQKAYEVDEDYSESTGDDDCDLFPVDLLKLLTPTGRVLGTTDCTRGIGVGSTLVWNLKGSRSSIGSRRKWKWLRMAGPSAVTDRIPRSKIHRWGGPYARRWLKRLEKSGGSAAAPTYNSESVWGNVFCQAFKVGLASYHFEPPINGEENGKVYISYENPSTSEWPPLDNGQPIPAKVYFHNVSFPSATTFRGDILWQQDYGTPWQGMIKWEYEMKFDEKFTCIVGGEVISYEVHAPETPRELSRYGEALVYCNAALYSEFRRMVTQEESETGTATTTNANNNNNGDGQGHNNNNNQDWGGRFRASSLQLRLRLQNEGASVRTIAMVHRLMTIAYQGEAEIVPIDYNISSIEERSPRGDDDNVPNQSQTGRQ